jgi:hypothetical protein
VSTDAVIRALDAYEAELRRIGAPVTAHLAPGISEPAIRELERRFGVELPDAVRTIWRWHNGVSDAKGARGNDAHRMLVPHRAFGDLEWSLSFADDFVQQVEAGNPASEYAGRSVVSLLIGNIGVVIDLTPGLEPLTYVNDPMSWSLSDYPASTIIERVDRWARAVRYGVWRVGAQGEWIVDLDRYPEAEQSNTL